MSQNLLFLDFENYYDDEYMLKKLTPPEYILDPRFESILLSAAVNNEPSHFIDGPDIPAYLAQFDPKETTTVCFNALYDNCILAWRYGFIPRRMLCSMRMAVAVRGHMLHGHSLAKIGECLKLGQKGTTIHNVKGLHRNEIIREGLWNDFITYGLNDNDMSRRIFFECIPDFPEPERRTMDLVLRCAVEPEFWVDLPMLRQHLNDLEQSRAELLARAGVSDPSELRSNPRFQALLESHGVEVKTKVSATGNIVPAFAKTDDFMVELQEHEDPDIQALAAARLGVRSTIEQTRSARILSIGSLNWDCYRPGNVPLMPIPLRFSGAHTHRLSGEWAINMQNLPTGRNGQPTKLRKALIAPPGHQVVVADLEQIECRVTAWLCGQLDLLDVFARGLDPYAILASGIFGYDIDKAIHKLERFIGKSGVLGLGFRCGAAKFFAMVVRSARALGMDMGPLLAIWTQELAQRTVDVYRQQNKAIKNSWYELDRILETAWCGIGPAQQFGPVTISEGKIDLPSGLSLLYRPVCRDPQTESGLTYAYGDHVHPIHGGSVLENIVQALARIILMNAALRLEARGLRFKLQAHDELVFIVPDAAVAAAKEIIRREMTRPPSWAPKIPLGAAIGSGLNYGDAK